MNPFQVSQDPRWHRLVDGMVILTIGIALGMVVAQVFSSYETTTTTRVIRRTPTVEVPKGQSGQVHAPESSVKFEEI